MIYFFVHTKITYYWFNRQELLQKAKDKYHNCGGKEKEKVAKYYLENEEVFFKKAKKKHRSLSEEEKEVEKEYGRNRYKKNERKNKLGRLVGRFILSSYKVYKKVIYAIVKEFGKTIKKSMATGIAQ